MNDFELLLKTLTDLEAHNRVYIAKAQEHARLLLSGQRTGLLESIGELELVLSQIQTLEELRINVSLDLAAQLGLPFREAPPKVEALIQALPSEAASRLRTVATRLRERVREASEMARRNAAVAQAGLQIVTQSAQVVTRIAVRRVQAPAVYGRSGKASTRPAVEVVGNRDWRA